LSFYDDKILPHIISCACSLEPMMAKRQKILPLAYGDVLEVGMGSGLNLQLYDANKVSKVWGLEPSRGMRDRAAKNLRNSPVEVEWLDLPGEQVPLPTASVDCAVLTFTLCTISDWRAALMQINRVLKPGGQLLFCEHGLAPDSRVQRWQHRLNPLWNKVFGGCNLNRPVADNIALGGFTIAQQHSEYLKHTPKFASYITYGQAHKAS
jgi:ubiquinone/menaquinone biosynthesis C-methylase UbiE